jgi:hypothetical protein
MTERIIYQIASLEHLTKQPFNMRYALWCWQTRKSENVSCESEKKMGHIADSADYLELRQMALDHPHDAFIQFYPDGGETEQSAEFTQDYQQAMEEGRTYQ